jgi:hypothetical protein
VGEGTAENKGAARRGRKPRCPDPADGPVAAFADRLWRLKREAGDPSFAEMSSRLGARASKSSLAAAAQGDRLPSWGTTWEFVRVLAVDLMGRDPAQAEREWRDEWRRARRLMNQDEITLPVDPSTPSLPNKSRVRWRGAAITVSSLAILAVLGEIFFRVQGDRDSGGVRSAPSPSAAPAGDDSRFEGDVTFPDGTLVQEGVLFTKVWRLRNAGTLQWRGRYLRRLNTSPCRAPERVAIPPAAPGQAIDVGVRVRAPKRSARCRIYWKMVDAQGRALLPNKRPIFLDVQIGRA